LERYGNPAVLGVGEPAKSALFVPLVSGGKATGVISLQNVDQEHAFSESDQRLLTTLAGSLSVALENARLVHETRQRNAELALINGVQDAIAGELDPQAIYDAVGDRIRDVFDAQVVSIATLDEPGGLIQYPYLIERGERLRAEPRPLAGFAKHVLETREPLLLAENLDAESERYGSSVVAGERPKSVLFVPLVGGGKAAGVISLQNIDREHAFDEDRRIGHASRAFVAAREKAFVRLDHVEAATFQGRDVLLHGIVLQHERVHRRRDDDVGAMPSVEGRAQARVHQHLFAGARHAVEARRVDAVEREGGAGERLPAGGGDGERGVDGERDELERAAEQRAHLRDLAGRRGALVRVVCTEHRGADRHMAGVRREVQERRCAIEPGEVLVERRPVEWNAFGDRVERDLLDFAQGLEHVIALGAVAERREPIGEWLPALSIEDEEFRRILGAMDSLY